MKYHHYYHHRCCYIIIIIENFIIPFLIFVVVVVDVPYHRILYGFHLIGIHPNPALSYPTPQPPPRSSQSMANKIYEWNYFFFVRFPFKNKIFKLVQIVFKFSSFTPCKKNQSLPLPSNLILLTRRN